MKVLHILDQDWDEQLQVDRVTMRSDSTAAYLFVIGCLELLPSITVPPSKSVTVLFAESGSEIDPEAPM